MNIHSAMRPARPPTVQELVAQAENFAFNTNIPLKQWVHAADTLYQEASFALSDDDYARAYTMLYRHSVLVLKMLPTHPQMKDKEARKMYRPLSRRIESVVKDLEDLKPEIQRAHAEWERMMPPAVRERPSIETPPTSYEEFAARDPSLSGNAKILDASEHQELAVDLAQQELTRRETVKRATRKAGISDEETTARRRAGRWDDWETKGLLTDVDFQRRMEETRRTLDSAKDQSYDAGPQQPISNHYHYPTVSRPQAVEYLRPPRESQPYLPSESRFQPSRPPKESLTPQNHLDSSSRWEQPRPPPLPPSKEPLYEEHNNTTPAPIQTPSYQQPLLPPKEPLSAELPLSPLSPGKKERLTFKPGAYLENGDPIRSVFIPRSLRSKFLEIASDNTRAGVEMCGMLCGTPINNALFIRCLLIPDQKCTPDTCETINESAMFDYCVSEDLIIIGWIHTHPTQTCFMSSRDLHTHAGYQVMMPESIAVVCSPKFTPSYGIFRLTNPPGLDHILDCQQKETFHQHSINNLYREAEQPHGHVYENDKLPFYVHDLRTAETSTQARH